MKTLKYGSVFFVLMLLLAKSSFAVRYTVCQSGDCNFKSVQEAINKAGKQDEIVIMDGAIYAEQVTIDSTKSGLVLRSDFAKFGKKPTIKFQDKVNVGPKDKDEALIDSLINFDQNGALRVLRAANVRIEGIIVDGGGNYPFGYDAVWEAKYALQHGNAAITLWIAGDVVVRDCEMQNAYIGLNVKDRNEGGVFAHPNPADISPENIIPFSAFAQTGNHLVEYCRIHNNSVGVFFESTWDMGATLRYNLFYENHHPTAAIATKVKGLTSEGGNQCGGALMFKDQMISPVAIYNNTFWHNSLIFVGNWKSGGHHLIFNNIYGAPNDYFGTSTTTFATSFEMSKCFANRMHNCIYSAMQQAPTANYTTITNDLKPAQPAGGGAFKEGAAITPFPASADIFWVEMGNEDWADGLRFMSTDPNDPNFLEPDWSDAVVQAQIIDKGWATAGVKDANGSPADLGAIPESGNRPVDVVTVRPTKPVEIKGSTAIINFEITPRLPETTPKDFKIVYLYAVTKLDTADVFGSAYKAITTTNITKVTIPATALKIGANTIEVPVPATGDFAFFEMIIEATGTNQLPFTTAVGFIPYRKMDYLLDVTVLDKVNGTAVTTVRAGQQVVLNVKAKQAGKEFTNLIDPTDVKLLSRFDLLNPTGGVVASIPGGITKEANIEVVFTRVPVGGVEFVHVAGRWISSGKVIAFYGSSAGVTVLAGPADSVQFQTPASKQTSVIDPMTTELVKVQAFDKYGNPVDSTYAIQVVSLKPLIGKITDTVEDTKAGGIATFYAMVTDGDKDEIFPLVATLVAKPTKTDTAYLKVGQARDKLWIFYGDTLVPDPTAGIDTCAGIRVPVTIRASKDGKTIATDKNSEFTISLAGGLAAFETETSGERLLKAQLVNGKAKIWITSTGGNVVNGTITLKPEGLNGGSRDKINFKSCYATPKRGAYFTTNGKGAVDMAKVYYERAIEANEIPDSIVFYWPSTTTQARIAKKMDITQDPTDKRILNVVLPQPFAEGFTRYTESGAGLGLAYWANPLTLDEKTTLKFPFDMADSVGPLIATATLIERLTAGNDSMVLTFTENVPHTSVAVNGLTLLKKQADGSFLPVELQILQAEPSTNGATIVTVKNVGEATAPKEGDSLRITPAGPIVDISNNKAHLLNRAVVITTQKIAPDIVSARYEDRNADGKIETVQISFNKGVTPSEMAMQFKWESVTSKKAESERMTVVNPTTVDVNIDSLFSDVALKDKTSGTLTVTVVFSSYEVNNKKDKTATDGAAPVLDSVEYHYGRLTKDMDSIKASPDTLYVAFTETVKGPEQFTQPLLFTTAAGVPYTVTGVYSGIVITKTGIKFNTYVVNPLPVGIHPIGKDFVKDPVTNAMVEKPGDSAWINTVANVTDNVAPAGNIQLNVANKRVAIVVIQPPFELIANVGPNPFNPKNSKLRITLKAVTAVAMPTDFVVNAVIYDKVGNVVKRIPEDFAETNGTVRGKFIEAKDSCVLWWDGTNKQGRIVGIGTYMVLIKTRYTTKPSPTVSEARTLPIGVRAE